MAAKIKAGALEANGTDRWYVTDGQNAVGPVRLDLLVRGVASGRVPVESFVRHEAWKVWRPLTDFADVSEGHEQTGAHDLGSLLQDVVEPGSMDEGCTMDVRADELHLSGESLSAAPTNGSPIGATIRDPLGHERPTLDSYADDDDTTVPPVRARPAGPSAMPPVTAPPRPASVPPPPPRPGSVPPPRPPSLLPARSSATRPASVPPPRPGSIPPPRPQASSVPRPISVPPPPPARSAQPSVPQISQGAVAIGDIQPQTDDVSGYARPADSGDALPSDDLAGANDLSEGLLLLLGAAVKRAHADVALLHRMADEGATVLCAHGPNMVDVLGSRTRLLDAAVVAAAGGHQVVAEPVPGPAGEATRNRLCKLGAEPDGVVMMPIRPRGRLLGLLELGKRERFTMRELALAEALVIAFVARAEALGWS